MTDAGQPVWSKASRKQMLKCDMWMRLKTVARSAPIAYSQDAIACAKRIFPEVYH